MLSYAESTSAEHPFSVMLAMLGVSRLHVAIEQGRLADVVSPEELFRYTTVAMVRSSADCPDGAEEFAEEMLLRLICVLSSGPDETPRLRADGFGRLFLVESFEPYQEVEVNEDRIRHWEWMSSIFGYPEAARALVSAVPDALRERARAHLEDVASRRFDEIVAGLDFGAS